MSTILELETPYEHVLSEELVGPADRLLRATNKESGETSLVLAQKSGAEWPLMSLKGLGKEIWQGQDAQEYVDRLRAEWRR